MGLVPSTEFGAGDAYPVYSISWNDAQDFVTALNAHITNTGQGAASFRLPSESEWEYGCRAGTSTRFYFGDSLGCADMGEDCAAGTLPGARSDYMWYAGNNTPIGAKPVGQRLPNAFGLFDMTGNVLEFCQDLKHGSYEGAPVNGESWSTGAQSKRVTRGGNWIKNADGCRSAYRSFAEPDAPGERIGLRLARDGN